MDKVQSLYQAADLLQLDYVRDTCGSYMAMNIEGSSCVDLYKFADVFSVDIVKKSCLKWKASHFTEVASSEEFCNLGVNELTDIISHDELDVKEETTVWEAVVRWLQHSRRDRLRHLPSILPHIRFNLLTSDDTAAILEHPLVKKNRESSEVIRKVTQKGNPNLRPRLGMYTEVAVLNNWTEDGIELLFINPREGKYISRTYSPEDLPRPSHMTVTSDNEIYILTKEESDVETQLSLYKYNPAKNVWEDAGVPSISRERHQKWSFFKELLFEVDGTLYYVPVDEDRSLVQMKKYNRHTKQWLECSPLHFDEIEVGDDPSLALSCGSHIYFLTNEDICIATTRAWASGASEPHRWTFLNSLQPSPWEQRFSPQVLTLLILWCTTQSQTAGRNCGACQTQKTLILMIFPIFSSWRTRSTYC
ncbi:kelch-like protein 6 [Branchiostoma floridae x Branchiostoma japonicum]